MSEMTDRLADLTEVPKLRREVDVVERDRIAAARAAGAPWDRIAAALGIKSRQGAQQRYATLVKATETETTTS
ncbi:hypothetical protein ABZ799_28840 [Nocardiopsis dassonvillei]|uniref:hypothetical protein n=1 Tax=Nocardiopsis dassonvillei TaxID=2014 RepID=UPI00340049B1